MDKEVQNAYLNTIKYYEKLEQYICSADAKCYSSILGFIKICLNEVDQLIYLESYVESNYVFIALLQLKSNLQILMKTAESKITQVKQLDVKEKNKNPEVKKIETNIGDVKIFDTISSMEEKPRVAGLNELAGLWEVKKLLKSLVLLPKTQPQLFENRKICNSLLLFGPPGTGKTRIVHALASETGSKFYSVSAGGILSSFVGETERTIKTLFKTLKQNGDSCIIFFDEVDAFCRKRTQSEHEHTRRVKTELMCQLSSIEDCKHLFVICATNCPWDLDTAILRRYDRKIYIPLPNRDERSDFLQLYTKNTPLEIDVPEAWENVLDETEGFSGSDLSNLIQTALTIPLNELEETKIWELCDDGFYQPVKHEQENFSNIVCCNLGELPANSVRARPATILDLMAALDTAGKTVSLEEVNRFQEFIKIK